jgi:CBS domain-containing protein
VAAQSGRAGSATISDPTISAGGDPAEDSWHDLLEVQRGGALVADMMSFPVTTVDPTTPMTKIRQIMEKEKIRGVVVKSRIESRELWCCGI